MREYLTAARAVGRVASLLVKAGATFAAALVLERLR